MLGVEHNKNDFAPEAATDEPASPRNQGDSHFSPPPDEHGEPPLEKVTVPIPAGALDFDPVPLRYRTDGLTPEKQREYVEALADCGVARQAAARIGVSEQAINRVRRRADARSLNLACEAARRIGARRLHATAWERAIEGTVKRHHYHGELKSEEVVFDNRLLIYLLGKTEHLLDEPAEARAVAENWEPFMEAMEQGLPPPDLRSQWERDRDEMLSGGEANEDEGNDDEEEDEDDREEVWEEEGGWMTSFPPPADFDGAEDGVPGMEGYRRSLTEAEEEAMQADEVEDERERLDEIRRACARRDRYFGFEGGLDEWVLADLGEEDDEASEGAEVFSSREAETYETSEASGSGGAGLESGSEPPVQRGLESPSEGDGEAGEESPRDEERGPRVRSLAW